MQIIQGSQNFSSQTPNPTVTMGNFDGVHRAHQKLINASKAIAQKSNSPVLVYTFDPHPAQVLMPESNFQLLQTKQQKMAALESRGVDICVVEKFSKEFAQLSPEDFFKLVIVERLHAKNIIVGYDFTFGNKRAGNISSLEKMCQQQQINCEIINAQFDDQVLISSHQIRELVATGNITTANKLLGSNYRLQGKVVKGRGLGGSLGAHTANLECQNEIIPCDGVYLSRTSVCDNSGVCDIPSISSIGWNPTFLESPFSIETHLLDIDIDILGKEVAVDFLERMRDQIKFATPEALKQQIAADTMEARKKHGLC